MKPFITPITANHGASVIQLATSRTYPHLIAKHSSRWLPSNITRLLCVQYISRHVNVVKLGGEFSECIWVHATENFYMVCVEKFCMHALYIIPAKLSAPSCTIMHVESSFCEKNKTFVFNVKAKFFLIYSL